MNSKIILYSTFPLSLWQGLCNDQGTGRNNQGDLVITDSEVPRGTSPFQKVFMFFRATHQISHFAVFQITQERPIETCRHANHR